MTSQQTELFAQYNSKVEDYYYNSRLEMLKYIPANAKRILDIGCSTGGFGAAIKQKHRDVEVWGLEPYEDAANIAKNVLDNVIFSTFQSDLPALIGEKFDIIIFNDVLEHLIDPTTTLQLCKKHLTENGHIVASLPNILYYPIFFTQIIIKEDWKYTQEGTLDNTHLRFFTRKSMIRLFEEAGYQLKTIEGINCIVPFHYWILNFILLNKIKDWRFRQFAITATLNEIS